MLLICAFNGYRTLIILLHIMTLDLVGASPLNLARMDLWSLPKQLLVAPFEIIYSQPHFSGFAALLLGRNVFVNYHVLAAIYIFFYCNLYSVNKTVFTMCIVQLFHEDFHFVSLQLFTFLSILY